MRYDADFIRRRYNRLAPIYPVFEYVFWLPKDLRRRAVDRLELLSGARVLEVGCGTGRNLPLLIEAVGPAGRIYGVDLSEGMLAVAARRCARRGWRNVALMRQDACHYSVPEDVDGVLFSFSYEVIPQPREALRQSWTCLRPGGQLVVLGQKTPRGQVGKWLRPLGILTSQATVLGDPDRRPWDDLRVLTTHIDLEEARFGYYICRGTKSEHPPPPSASGALPRDHFEL